MEAAHIFDGMHSNLQGFLPHLKNAFRLHANIASSRVRFIVQTISLRQ